MIDYNQALLYRGAEDRIKYCMEKAKAGREITVAFLGGSITQGSLAAKPEYCYAYLVWKWWQEHFPQTKVVYLNAGIGGTTSCLGVARVEEEVLSKSPDFVLVEFSVNDEDDSPFFMETYESLVRRILMSSKDTALLLLQNVRYDDGGNAGAIHEAVGRHYNVPVLSVKPVIYQQIMDGKLAKRDITPDDLHPGDKGHQMVASCVTAYLDRIWEQLQDPSKKAEKRENAELILPKPITKNRFEKAVRMRNDKLIPLNTAEYPMIGFLRDDREQECISDCFSKGWIGKKMGEKIAFQLTGSVLMVQYRKNVKKPAPVAKAVIDGDTAHAVVLDANFEQEWGNCLYLEMLLQDTERKDHIVEIEIVQSSPEDIDAFYLVSVITA